MTKPPTVRMVQDMPAKWHIVSNSGIILQRGITVGTIHDAEQYVRAYVSSFNDWTYEVVPLVKVSTK